MVNGDGFVDNNILKEKKIFTLMVYKPTLHLKEAKIWPIVKTWYLKKGKMSKNIISELLCLLIYLKNDDDTKLLPSREEFALVT